MGFAFGSMYDGMQTGKYEYKPTQSGDFSVSLLILSAALMKADNVSTRSVNAVMRILRDLSRSVALRGLCAIVIGMHGHAGQRRNLKHHYAEEPSDYVRTAILFSTRYFPAAERRSCNNAWSGHSTNHSLVSEAVRTLV